MLALKFLLKVNHSAYNSGVVFTTWYAQKLLALYGNKFRPISRIESQTCRHLKSIRALTTAKISESVSKGITNIAGHTLALHGSY